MWYLHILIAYLRYITILSIPLRVNWIFTAFIIPRSSPRRKLKPGLAKLASFGTDTQQPAGLKYEGRFKRAGIVERSVTVAKFLTKFMKFSGVRFTRGVCQVSRRCGEPKAVTERVINIGASWWKVCKNGKNNFTFVLGLCAQLCRAVPQCDFADEKNRADASARIFLRLWTRH